MSLHRLPADQALARMVGDAGFSAIIDARSEGEFALDHLPGAVNWPSLNDEQRIVIGTLFKEKGGFEAQKLGAAWVAVNIARHIEREVRLLSRLTRHRLPLLALGIELGCEHGEFGLAGVGELDCLGRAL